MTSTSTLSLVAAGQLVSNFHVTLTAHNTAHTGFKDTFDTDARARLYKMLASGYGVSLALTADPVVLGQLCAHHGTNAPGADENPHSAPVRLMWGKKNKATGKLEPNRSAWKYGKAYRAAQALGWTEANFAENIEAFEYEASKPDGTKKRLKRMIALEAFDTAEHGNKEADRERDIHVAAQRWQIKVEEPKARFAGDLGIGKVDNGQMASVVVQWNAANSEWVVRDIVQADHDKAWSAVSKLVIPRYKEWLEEAVVKVAAAHLDGEAPESMNELLDALREHRHDVEQAEADAEGTRKLTEWTQDDAGFVMPTEHVVTGEPVTTRDQDTDSASA